MCHFVMAVNYTGQKYYEMDHCVHTLHLLLYSSRYGSPIQCQTVKFWDWYYHKKYALALHTVLTDFFCCYDQQGVIEKKKVLAHSEWTLIFVSN